MQPMRNLFERTLVLALKGDCILYHVGAYCAGAHRVGARAAFDGGSVPLTMRKRDRFVFEYIAIPVSTTPS